MADRGRRGVGQPGHPALRRERLRRAAARAADHRARRPPDRRRAPVGALRPGAGERYWPGRVNAVESY
ncbi:hypothetical protein V2I01_33785 [Micromonospora sp. BRA006-A]|nr:hypothetical protein [Micromonospora sp. BRA006-A]